MKKIRLFLPVCIFIFNLVHAQQAIPDYGKVTVEDLQMKSCSFEPDAPAMKLFDVQEIEFEFMTYGARMKTERRIRVKIFNEKGYTHATIKIPYLNKKFYGKMRGLKGIVYNLDASGKIIKHELKEDDFYKQKATENFGIVNFTFPNLRPGSIIEYSYTRVEKNILQLDPWVVQDEIPVAYSTNIITLPSQAGLSSKTFGTDTITSVVDMLGSYNTRRRTTYFQSNVPSFKNEPFMTSRRDNMIRMSYLMFPRGGFWLSTTAGDAMWKAVSGTWKSGLYKEHIENRIPGTEKIIDSARKITNITDRIGYVYARVNRHNQNKPEQALSVEDLKEAWNTQATTSSELNLILLNLLHHAEVRAFPLLVSTRDNGKVDPYFPSFGQMNGIDVIAFYDSSNFFIMDASIPHQSFLTPPINILNRDVLYVNSDETQWFTITDTRPLMKQNLTIFADLKNDGIIEGTATFQHFDYAKTYRLDTTMDESSARDNFYDDKTPGLKILSVKQENAENYREPLFETTDFTFETTQANDIFYINPQFFFGKIENPFKSDKRIYEIDFGCNQELVMSMEINLPSGFETDQLPKNVLLTAPDSSFSYKRVMSSDANRVIMTQIYEIKRSQFRPDEYRSIQDFFKRLYALMNEEIVVRKKK